MAIVLDGTSGITTPGLTNTGVETISGVTTIQGITVGKGGGAVATNTAVGASALAANSTGQNTTALGYQAATATTTNNVTAVGSRALLTNSSGSSLVAVGGDALRSNSTGPDNTAVGQGAMYSNTTGAYGTAIGSGALLNNTTASYNVAVGFQAGYSGTTANSNVASGAFSLYSNTIANRNTAIGYSALYAYNRTATTDGNMTAVGFSAGASITTGQSCTFIGCFAGQSSTGTGNTFIGQYSAGVQTSGDQNSYFGSDSGSAMTTGAKNTILGRFSGNQTNLDVRTVSNNVILSDGDGTPVAYFQYTGYTYLGSGTRGADGGIILAGTATSGQGPCIVGSTGPFNARSDVWYAGSNSFSKGGTAYSTYTVMSASGGVSLTSGATAWTSASDERLKDIIEPITDATNKVSQLRAVIGKYKTDEEGKRRSFLIAQDVQSVLPEAVTEGRNSKEDETEYLHVAYTEVIPLLVAAIKELKAEIDILKGNV